MHVGQFGILFGGDVLVVVAVMSIRLLYVVAKLMLDTSFL